jgi:twitching motility protein PilT
LSLGEAREKVLRTFLREILKDGKVDGFEESALKSLLPLLKIPQERYDKIYQEVYHHYMNVESHEGREAEGPMDMVSLLHTVRSQLMESFSEEQTQAILERICQTLEIVPSDLERRSRDSKPEDSSKVSERRVSASAGSSTAVPKKKGSRVIDGFLSKMVKKEASDLHLQVNYPVTYRVHGELRPDGAPISRKDMVSLLGEILSSSQKRLLNQGEELDFAYELPGVGRFRGNIFLQSGQFGAVFRLIPETICTFEEIFAPQALPDLCELNHGLILVTGPTGSGKSTTIATLLDRINLQREGHILTLEDPIEFVHKNKKSLITHKEIGRDIPSFQAGLHGAYVQNVDVVLVGEIRDAGTMISTLDLAEAGVLVLATLHSLDAANTVKRVVSFFDEEARSMIRARFAQNVQAIVSMKLLPDMNQSRVAAWELALLNSAMRNLIKDGREHQIESCIEQGKKEGMKTFDMSIRELMAHGRISKQIAQTYMSRGK